MENSIIIEGEKMSGEPLQWLYSQNLPLLYHVIMQLYTASVLENGTGQTAPPTPEASKCIFVLQYFLNHLQQHKQSVGEGR